MGCGASNAGVAKAIPLDRRAPKTPQQKAKTEQETDRGMLELSVEDVGNTHATVVPVQYPPLSKGAMASEKKQLKKARTSAAKLGKLGERSALIIVDVQNDFISGTLGVRGAKSGLVSAINAFRERNQPDLVVHTQDSHPADHCSFHENHPGTKAFESIQIPAPGKHGKAGEMVNQVMWPRHCVKGTVGHAFHPRLRHDPTDIVVQKGEKRDVDSYSGFFDNFHGHETPLRRMLAANSITTIYVCGLAFDFCVGSTAFDGKMLGFRTVLLQDLTRSVGDETEAAMRKKLLDAGVALVDSTGVAVQTQRTHSEMVASQVSKYTQQLAQMSTQHSVRHRTVRFAPHVEMTSLSTFKQSLAVPLAEHSMSQAPSAQASGGYSRRVDTTRKAGKFPVKGSDSNSANTPSAATNTKRRGTGLTVGAGSVKVISVKAVSQGAPGGGEAGYDSGRSHADDEEEEKSPGKTANPKKQRKRQSHSRKQGHRRRDGRIMDDGPHHASPPPRPKPRNGKRPPRGRGDSVKRNSAKKAMLISGSKSSIGDRMA